MTIAPSTHFVRGLEANLTFWSGHISEAPEQLAAEHPHLLQAVQFGLVLPETQLAAAELTLQLFAFIEEWGQWQAWVPILEKTLGSCAGNESMLRVRLLNRLGRWLRLNRRLEKAISIHQEAETLAGQLNDQQALAEIHLRLSEDYLDTHQSDLAEQYGKLALVAFERLHGSEAFQAAIWNILGLVALERGDWALAAANLQQAADLWRPLARPTQLARTLKNLGVTLQQKKSLDKALSCYQEALNCLEKTTSELDKIEVQSNIGAIYFEWGEFARAEAVFRQAGQAVRQLGGSFHISGSLAQNLGNALIRQKRFDEAETHLQHAKFLWQQRNNDLELANTLGGLGETMVGQGQVDEARSFYDEALELLANYPDNAWAKKLRAEFTAERETL